MIKLIDGGPDAVIVSTGYVTRSVEPVNYLWLLIDSKVNNRSTGVTRSVTVVANNENEAIEFINAARENADITPEYAKINCYPEWPKKFIANDFFLNYFKFDKDNCKIIQIGIANSDISKGILIADNLGSYRFGRSK